MSLAEALESLPSLPRIRIREPIATILTIVVIAALVAMAAPGDVPITQLQVRGELVRVQPEEVRAAAGRHLNSGFFTADVAAVRDEVAKLPWVRHASVERVWPAALAVHVWEREPLARWNEADLLDTEAKAFTPRGGEIPTGLPLLGGTPGHEVEVLDAWRRLSKGLADGPLQLVGLSLDPRGEWTARTQNGIELRFGQTVPDSHLATLTGSVKRTLDGRWDAVQYIDLRYTNGFSVGWVNREEGDGKAAPAGKTEKPGPKKR